MSIILTPTEAKRIKTHCNKIYSESRKSNIKDRKQDVSRSGKEINLQGMGAEYWLRKVHGLPFDFSDADYTPRTYLTDIDIILEGKRCEVKQTTYPSGCFFISSKDWYGKDRKLLADIYILVVGTFPDYTDDYYISKKHLIELNPTPTMHKRIGRVGYHVEQDDMYPTFEEVMNH
jgi:hypothetical protein